jgi:hypothetical protein
MSNELELLRLRKRKAQAMAGPADNPPQPAVPTEPASRDSYYDQLRGGMEVLGTMGSSMLAEPAAGIAGIAQSINPMADSGSGARAVESTRNALTYMPKSKQGKENLLGVADKLKPLSDILQYAEQASGDLGYDLAGPIGGAIGSAVPAAISEALGLTAAKVVSKAGGSVKRVADAVPDAKSQSILDAGIKADVPVLTSDVKPPTGYIGRWTQSLSEKLGVLGTGSARADQQVARQSAVAGLADAMDIDLDTPFADKMVRSISAKHAKSLERAGAMRDRAVKKLDPAGAVPMNRTNQAIFDAISEQKRLGKKGDEAFIQSVSDIRTEVNGKNFSLIKDHRSSLIKDKAAAARGEDTRFAGPLQNIKSAMDKDMMEFASRVDRGAAADWVRSNRAFAEGYSAVKDTELKRVLASKDITPEKILPYLRGGKPSELNRIHKAMGAKGRDAARGAIIQDALKESKFFEVDSNPNPDAFATAMNKSNRQQAVRVFFGGRGKAEIDGLTRLLDSTRRAQQGSTVLKTGEQVVPMLAAGGVTAGVMADAATAIPVITLLSGFAKAYESTKFRNLLLKLGNTKKGSKAETGILELVAVFAAGESQVAKKAQEETEQ